MTDIKEMTDECVLGRLNESADLNCVCVSASSAATSVFRNQNC